MFAVVKSLGSVINVTGFNPRSLMVQGPDGTRRETGKLNPRSGWFNSLALSTDGRRLAAGTINGRIMIWDAASHEEVATLEGHTEEVKQLAFTPDGDHLVSASQDQLRVWRAASPAETDSRNNSH